MPKDDFAGLLPENFEEFRSLEFWEGFFKARGSKVNLLFGLGLHLDAYVVLESTSVLPTMLQPV